MFKYEENNRKIGAYLKKLIEKKYPSHRQFARDYLNATIIKTNDDELRKFGNRLSQILNGKKAIQTYDLPVFTKLLGVSCEEILSAGKSFIPISGHITNYTVAFSKDKDLWKEYVERPDKLILNPDEYNKTVIDYAIEFRNYAFIKFLIDRGDIWFVDDSKYDCADRIFGYGAGTNIKRRDRGSIDTALDIELQFKCEERGLRQNVVAMALENKDFDILDSLKAREVPALYQLCIYGNNSPTKCRDYYNEDVIEAIAQSSDKVLSYFSDKFEITDQQGRKHSFIYPFLNEVIQKLIKNKNKYAEPVIREAIEYNKKVYDALSDLINNAAKHIQENYPDWKEYTASEVKKETMQYFSFDVENGFVSYLFAKARSDYSKICANAVRTDAISDNLLIGSLIKELNKTFSVIQNIEPIVTERREVK